MRKFLIFFFFFNLLLSSYYLDVWPNANTTSRALPIVTFFESGTFRIDKYHELTVDKAHVNGHYYTDKAPLPTYVVVPFFGLLKIVGLIKADANGSLLGNHVYMLGGFLTASLPFAMLLIFVFMKIRRTNPNVSPVLLATIPFYASFLFVFTGTYFAHILSAVLLLASYLFIQQKKFLTAGILGGLAFLCEYNLAVILLVWGLWIWLNERSLKPAMIYSAGILPALIFLVFYNARYSSSPFTFMYKHHNFTELDANYGFVIPDAEPFWGLTFSFYRGIFFFAPFLLAVFLVAYRYLKNRNYQVLLKSYLLIPFTLYFIFVASYFAWWGGWTYGPRLLLAMVLILLYELVMYFSKHPISRVLFYVLSFAGLLVIMPAKGTIAYSAPTGIYNPFYELVLKGIGKNIYNPNNIVSMLFPVNPGIAFLIFVVVFVGGFTLFYFWDRKWVKE